MSARLLCLATTAALACATAAWHRALLGHPAPAAAAAAAPWAPTAWRLLSLGNAAAAADIFYLRAVHCFGGRAQDGARYPALAGLLQRSVALDGNALAPYLLAGTGLLVAGSDPNAGLQLLQRGRTAHPTAWQLPFYLGFHAYQTRQDITAASQLLGAAATLPGAPLFLGPVATRLAARSNTPELGLQLLDALIDATDDDGVRATLQARRPVLLLELRLQRLRGHVAAYVAATGAPPATAGALQHFLRAGAATEPAHGGQADWQQDFVDPFGGYFALARDGNFVTAHQKARLQLHATGTPPSTAEEGR